MPPDPCPDCMNRAMEKLRHEVYEQMWVQASLQLQERSKATSEKIA